MEKIMNYVKSFVIAAMVLTSGNVWGNTLVANTGGDAFSSINNYVCTLPASNHVTFYFEKMTHSNDFKRNNSKELQFNKETAMELRWVVNVGYTIEVSSVEIKMAKGVTWGDKYFALGNSLYDGSSKYHREKLNNQSDHTFSISGLSYGNNDVVPMYKDDYDCYLKSIKVTYTLTPNAPSIVPGQEEHSIMAAIHGGDNQEVDLRNVFSRVDASHTSITYECNSANSANASITDGVFSATVAGDYTVHAIIVAKADCHEASAWSRNVTIHVAPRVSKIAPEISNTFSTYYVEDASIDLRDLWTSTSKGAITYTLVSFTPLAGAIHAGATAPSLTDGHLLSLGQAGTVRLSLHQEEGTSHLALENDAIYDLVISKRTPIISWSEDPIYFNGTYENIYTITAGDPSLFSIESSDAQVASVAGTTMTTYNKNASTALTVTAAENYKWAGETFEKIVTPEVAPNHVTINFSEVLLNSSSCTKVAESGTPSAGWNEGEKRLHIYGSEDNKYYGVILKFEGYPDKLSYSFRPQRTNGMFTLWEAQYMPVYESFDGNTWTCIHGNNVEVSNQSEYIDVTEQLSINTRYIRFEYKGGDKSENGGFYKNIQITELHKFEASTASLDFQQNQLNHVPAVKSFVFSHVNAGYTTTVTAPAHYQVSLSENSGYASTVVVPNTGGDKMDDVTVYVKYLADAEGEHNSNITITDNLGSNTAVVVSATTVGKLATTIEYIGAASYAVNADNMSATELFRVVDANGDEVATPVITLATSDAEKINVVSDAHAIDFLCGGSATITASYAGDETYAAAEESLSQLITVNRLTTDAFVWGEIAASYEVETEIPALATANSGLAVTYTSSNEAVIKVVDGKIMTVGKGTAILTAHTAGDCNYDPIEESKDITMRPHEQNIEWNQSFLNIVKNGVDFSEQDVNLVAMAKDHEGEETGVAISFSVADNGVATIVDNTLHFVGAGTTTITARTADNSLYETTSFEKTIRVRNYGEKCLSYLINDATTHNDIENSDVFETTWKNTYGDLVDATRPFSFDMKTSFWASRTFTIEIQTTTSSWTTYGENVGNSGDWKTVGDRKLPANCTGIRFRFSGGAVGSASVRSLKVPMASYVSTVEVSPQFTGTAVAYNDLLTNTIAVKFADVPQIDCEVVDFQNNTDDKTLSAASVAILNQSRMSLENTCGEYNTYNFALSGNFKKVGTISGRLHFHTAANDHLYIPFEFTITPATRTLHWDEVAEGTNTAYPQDEVVLNAYGKTAYEKPAGSVEYEITSDPSVAHIADGKLYFDKEGVVNLKVAPVESDEYVEENPGYIIRSWSVGKLDVTVKTAPAITTTNADNKIYVGDAKSVIVFDNKGAVAVQKNNESVIVPGEARLLTPEMFSQAGATTLHFDFVPDVTSVYNTTTFDVDVEVYRHTPEVSVLPTASDVTYAPGIKLSESLLTGGTASVKGTYAWENGDEELTAGTASHNVIFTPDNTTMYEPITISVPVTVNKADPTITWPIANAIKLKKDGTITLADVTFASAGTGAGTFAWSNAATVLTETGSYEMIFTPTDAANYNTATADVAVTVVPAKKTYDEQGWSDEPTAEDDVEIKSDLVINDSVVVNGLTIDPGVKVTLEVSGSLTVNGTSDDLTNYGDLIINAGGQVILGNDANLQVNNLELNTELGNRYQNAKSSQVKNVSALNVNGNAYIDITIDPTGTITFGWYDVAVPFPVDMNSGIYWVKEDGTTQKLVNGVDFAFMAYSEAAHAAGKYGWAAYNGILQPGVGYTMTLNDDYNYNVVRFVKTSAGALNTATTMPLVATTTADESLRGWNELGNGTLTYADLSATGISKAQIYDHTSNSYVTVNLSDYSYVIGSRFSVQTSENDVLTYIPAENPAADKLYAPQRSVMARTSEEFMLTMEYNLQEVDRLYLSADDEALNTYEIGRDLAKQGVPTEATLGQIWANNYGKTLCDVELPFEGNQATFPISIFAPAAGEYNLHVAKAINGQRLYLLEDGMLIWDLTMSDYPVSLSRGTTTNYSLMITRPQGVVTDVEEKQADSTVEKIFVGGKLYVIKNGMIFDATGKKVK